MHVPERWETITLYVCDQGCEVIGLRAESCGACGVPLRAVQYEPSTTRGAVAAEHVPERTFTLRDVRTIATYARFNGSPSITHVIADLDAKGKLDPPTTQGAVSDEGTP